MKMRKFLALLLAAAMALSGSVMAFAADSDDEDDGGGGGLVEDVTPDAGTTDDEVSEADMAALAKIFMDHWDELPKDFTEDKPKDDFEAWPDDWAFREFIVSEIKVENSSYTWRTGFSTIWGEDGRLIALTLTEMGLTGKLDVSGLDGLEYLNCTQNRLTSLDVSGFTKLSYLACEVNRLTSLDVSGCTELQTLYCDDNRLTKLDVSSCKELTNLSCNTNQLTSLNVSGCSKLDYVDCAYNNLTALDLSSCVKGTLHWVYCHHNLFPSTAAIKLSFSAPWDKNDIAGQYFRFTPQDTKPAEKTEQKDHQAEANRQAQEAAMDALRDANSGKATSKVITATTAGGASVSAVSVKLYGMNAAITMENMEVLASGSTGLQVDLDGGAAQVLIPAGFTIPRGTGVFTYPLGHQLEPMYSGVLRGAVKGDNPQTEVHLLGGGELPVAATVTLKTTVNGPVNVYFFDPDTWKVRLLTGGVAENGKVTFATKQLGNLIVTTGTI